MRLICPNCGAQYEVADDVIPQDGRDVQCSNCGHTWFKNFGASDVKDEFLDTSAELSTRIIHEDAATWDDVADTAPEPKEPQRQELDPAIADILREEAAREADARRRETEAAIESQPDLGLDTATAPDRRAQETERRIALLKGEEVAADQAETAAASRHKLQPYIEEINSSLRSDAKRAATDAPMEAVKRRRSFRSGFFGILLILAFLAALYVFAPQISDTVPALAPTLDRYAATVDSLRLWIDLKLQGMVNATNADG